MKRVKVHHVKWQIHTFLSLNSLTSQLATLQHTWELSYPLERFYDQKFLTNTKDESTKELSISSFSNWHLAQLKF